MGVWVGGVALLDASYGTAFRDLLNLKCAKEEVEGGVGVGVILQRGRERENFRCFGETRLELRVDERNVEA
jgi:hypothetical protein